MNSNKVLKESGDFKQRDNFIKQQQQLKAMKPTGNSKGLSADSMIEDLLSKKETFQKKVDNFPGGKMQAVPSWLSADNSTVHPMYLKIWEMVKCSPLINQQSPALADTPMVSALLMTSGLSTDMLGFIWSLANATVPGALTQSELYSVLALVALAQSGYIFNNVAVLNNLPQPPLPNLNLSVLVQLKGGFNVTSPAVVQAPSGMVANPASEANLASSGNSSGCNYFSDFQTAPEARKPTDNTIVSLDVNNLQSAASLTVPSSLVYSSVHAASVSGEQEFAAFQSAQPNVPSAPAQMNSFQNASSVNNAIPSISLGISVPQAVQNIRPISLTTQMQNTQQNSGKKSVFPVRADMTQQFVSSGNQKIDVDNFQVSFSSTDVANKFTKLNLGDIKNGEPEVSSTKQTHHTTSDTFNVDESFDSLCSERASTTKPSATHVTDDQETQKPISKPNYNINLFDSYSDVKSIFPVSGNVDVSETDVSDDAHVMHNPLFSNDEKCSENIMTSLSSNVTSKVKVEEDDFTDFQSADFTSFNNKIDEFQNSNFTDFQQASVLPVLSLPDSKIPSTNNVASLTEGTFVSSKSSSETNDDDLFPSLNLQFDSSAVGMKLTEPSDSLSIKSIDISIISSGRDTRANSSPVSSDYECQEMRKETGNGKETGDFNFESYKDDKTFLSLSSSIVFDNNNASVVPESDVNTKCKNTSQPVEVINAQASVIMSSPFSVTSAQTDDKYSALRMLGVSSCEVQSETSENLGNDDFGDFVAAGTTDSEQLVLPDVSTTLPESCVDNRSSEIKCLDACANILEKSYNILKSISTPSVLQEILSDPRGTMHISCLLEVYRVSERLMQHAECKSTPLASRVQTVWKQMIEMVPDDVTSYHKQLEENLGPKCGVCKCNYGPTPVRYGLNYYHPPCANLYLLYVSPQLPSVST